MFDAADERTLMQRLLYISTTRKPLDGKTLEDILRISRRNNASVGVTGLLVVGGRRFLQALEGPSDAVMEVFDRIARDPRHFAIVRLSTRQIETRLFGDWAMGCRKAGPAGKTGGTLQDIVAHLVAAIDDVAIRAEFTAFAALHSAAA